MDSTDAGILIDYRDLLLNSDEAYALGGSGNDPYGTFASILFNAATTFLSEIDDDSGLPKFNKFVVAPLTEGQSSTRGTFVLTKETIDFYNRSIMSSVVDLSLSNTRIENLDRVGSPLLFLQPKLNRKHVLSNELTFGDEANPLRFF